MTHTKDEALQMCLEYIETDAHERKYVRHAIKQALAAQHEPENEPYVSLASVQEPVHQWQQKHSPYWYDGYPDNDDGGGPYETRTLYTTPPPPAAQPAVPDAIHHTDLSEHPQYIEGWNDCRQAMMEMMK